MSEFGFFVGIMLLLTILYSYLIYPLIVSKMKKRYNDTEYTAPTDLPFVSLIISCYNEEKIILEKVKNINNIDYPIEKLEVLFGIDGSSDNTVNLLKESTFKFPCQIKDYSERRGKIFVIHDLVKISKGSILCFTDANTIFEKVAVKRLIAWFKFQEIGGVCGRLVLKPIEGNEFTEVTYWDYESKIKKWEGQIGYCIGANGGLYAIKTSLFPRELGPGLYTDDLVIGLNVLLNKKHFIFDEKAIGYEMDSGDLKVEFKRKIRIGKSNLSSFNFIKGWYHRLGLIANYFFISHKIIRWIIPVLNFLFIILAILNWIYFNGIWAYIAILFIFINLVSILNLFSPILNKNNSIAKKILYILVMNWGLFIGYVQYFSGKRQSFWTSTLRR